VVQGTVTIPGSNTEETISLDQKPAVINLNVKKSTAVRDSEYNAYISITLTKRLQNAQIFTPDFKNNGTIFSATLGTHALDCGLSSDVVQIDGTKLIKCSVLLPKEDVTYPLLISLNYGAEISKDFTFTLKGETTTA